MNRKKTIFIFVIVLGLLMLNNHALAISEHESIYKESFQEEKEKIYSSLTECEILNNPIENREEFLILIEYVGQYWNNFTITKNLYNKLEEKRLFDISYALGDARFLNLESPDILNESINDFLDYYPGKTKKVQEYVEYNNMFELVLGREYSSELQYFLAPTIYDKVDNFEEYYLNHIYGDSGWTFELHLNKQDEITGLFTANITVSLPDHYEEYDHEMRERFKELGDEYKYRKRLIIQSLDIMYDVAEETHNQFSVMDEAWGEADSLLEKVLIVVELHDEKILDITMTSENFLEEKEIWFEEYYIEEEIHWEEYIDYLKNNFDLALFI